MTSCSLFISTRFRPAPVPATAAPVLGQTPGHCRDKQPAPRSPGRSLFPCEQLMFGRRVFTLQLKRIEDVRKWHNYLTKTPEDRAVCNRAAERYKQGNSLSLSLRAELYRWFKVLRHFGTSKSLLRAQGRCSEPQSWVSCLAGYCHLSSERDR